MPPSTTTLTREALLKLYRAGDNNAQVAAFLGITVSELVTLLGNFEQDCPGFMNVIEQSKHYRSAIAKHNTLAQLEEGDVRLSQWELERTDPQYSPKNFQIPVTLDVALSPEERQALLSKFPSLALEDSTHKNTSLLLDVEKTVPDTDADTVPSRN